MSKAAQSGLGTIKRDFSSSGLSQPSEIEWAPTQPKLVAPGRSASRLKAIQDALRGVGPRGVAVGVAVGTGETKSDKKRTSPECQNEPPLKKPRQLPQSFRREDSLSESSLGSKSASAPSNTSGSKTTQKSTSSRSSTADASSSSATQGSKAKSKVAAVFLSQEQTHILKLVQDGHNIFYTGSAGAHIFDFFPLTLLIYGQRDWKIRSFAGDYQDTP